MLLRDVHYWVFDLDGTLTIPNHDFDAIRAELGIPRGHLILEYLDSLPPAQAQPLHVQLEAIETRLARSVMGQRGSRPMLEALAADGCRLGILTRNIRANAIHSLERLGVDHLFDAADVLGRDDAAAKPDPEGILHLLEHWQADPTHAAMVGDYRLDLEAGRNAGVRTLHIDTSGEFAWPELTDLALDRIEGILEHR